MGKRGPQPRHHNRGPMQLPPGMSTQAEAHWHTIVASCEPGHFRPEDAQALKAYCDTLARYDHELRLLQREGTIIKDPQTKKPRANPREKVVDRLLRLLKEARRGLRLLPTTRRKPRAIPPGPGLHHSQLEPEDDDTDDSDEAIDAAIDAMLAESRAADAAKELDDDQLIAEGRKLISEGKRMHREALKKYPLKKYPK